MKPPNSASFNNPDLNSIVTPIKVDVLHRFLRDSSYDEQKTKFLIDGFTNGFDLGYRGLTNRRDLSDNIPIKEHIGSKLDMWNKIMKEVELGRYAGPFEKPPFDNYIQSPIGLVQKAGNKTRLIFHLSYDFGTHENLKSFNYHTLEHMCSVHYRDLDHAIKNCIKILEEFPDCEVIFFAKTDLMLAFRQLPGRPSQYKWLLMRAQSPVDGNWYFFADKCVPFGASISCALFQQFSDALHHIIEFQTHLNSNTNYLDDFLFLAISKLLCNEMVNCFIQICEELNCPLLVEKTEWAIEIIIFLGVLLDSRRRILAIPEEKRQKALYAIDIMIEQKKFTVKQVQCLTGLLNFLNKAIVPGRAFTCRMYTKIALKDSKGRALKQYHHINLDAEFREDCKMWKLFLLNLSAQILCRPFIDIDAFKTATQLDFFTDSSHCETKGFGCVFGAEYTWGQWPPNFIKSYQLSIEYLEL